MSRRPLLARERPHLLRLGALLRTARRGAGMTQGELALAAGMHWTHLQRLELGTRRTRRSTLRRIAAALVVQAPQLGPLERLLDDLVTTAGPALAEESAYAERVRRRREVREDRDWEQARHDRLRSLIASHERWERSDYAQSMSEQEREEEWRERVGYFREWVREEEARRAVRAALS